VGHVVRFTGPGEVDIAQYDDRPLGPTEVRVKTLYSGISAGTELTAYRGSNPYLNKRWVQGRRLFVEDTVTFEYPFDALGAEEVGEVCEIGTEVTKVGVGDLTWGSWGHRSYTVRSEDDVARRPLPPGVDPIYGVFARIGAVALNAMLDSDIHVGEYVAVFGQGVPGLIASQLARLNGGTVVAVDGIPKRLKLSEELGAHYVVDFTQTKPAEYIKALTNNRGADVSIEITGSYRALNEAIRSTAYNSKVVASGFFQGDGVGLFLGEEFHHNRIRIVCSQIYGVSPHLDHRWSEERLEQTAMALHAGGSLNLRPLVTHVFSMHEADKAYELLHQNPSEAVQVVLEF
jgi:threonine dehydrogenase-like Zn-dependent dehydrogenase